MKGSAIRCSDRQHKFEAPSYCWNRATGRDRKCKHCGLYLQCFKGKHDYNRIVSKLATCSRCGKLIKRRKRNGVMNPTPR